MSRLIMPAFERYPEEAAIIGRLLAGYGEIEFELSTCLGEALNDINTAHRAFYRMRNESQRLDLADAIMQRKYEEANLGDQYADALGATRFCRRIRNQFAHCHWFDDPKGGLFFTDLQKSAQATREIMLRFRHVDPPQLLSQEAYFCYASDCLVFLHNELKKLKGRLKIHSFSMPQKLQRPSLYNPSEAHPIPSALDPASQK